MPDTKITALTAIGANPIIPATFPIPMVDLTDTSMAASGTTKKVTVNQILGAGGTATLASATITGDLTVDTNVLKVDTTNNRVGILTATPTAPLDILANALADALLIRGNDNSNTKIRMVNSGAGGEEFSLSVGYPGASNSSFVLRSITAGINRYIADQTGAHFWATNAGTAMTLNAAGLGVGVTPSAGKGCLQLSSGINFPATQVASSDVNTLDDYEEGTFTPIISGATTAGVGVYTTQVGRYTKIGRMVNFQLRVSWTAHTGTGGMIVDQLPFTASSVSNSQSSVTIGFFSNVALTASNVGTAFMQAGETSIALYQYPVGGGATSAVPIDSAADIMISGSYTV